MIKITNFNIRVYGLLINDKDQIIISSESYKNQILTKFIGGGLEKGEGLKSALEREFMEEVDLPIHVGELFYINDFFQPSYFNSSDQIISVYYYVTPKNWDVLSRKIASNDLNQILNWENINNFKADSLSLPIDQIVFDKLKNKV